MSPSQMATRPTIVGLYGIPGSGKTYLSNQLQQMLKQDQFKFFEGSQIIAELVDGGIEAFKTLNQSDKTAYRIKAINSIAESCSKSGMVGIVNGHYMFWDEHEGARKVVGTQRDLETFTHVIYLDTDPGIIVQRRQNDSDRPDRPVVSVQHLRKWQDVEKEELRRLCREFGILFTCMQSSTEIVELLMFIRVHTKELNFDRAAAILDEVVDSGEGKIKTMLVFDADKTLAVQDTGSIFWSNIAGKEDTLKKLFGSPLQYSHTAFCQATLLYEEVANKEEFERLCAKVASDVTLRPELANLLVEVRKHRHVGAVVVTCGIRRVWEMVLDREGLSDTVKVVGGGRIADDIVVTAEVKQALVARLQDIHGMYVMVFGDSPLDLGMMKQADRAIVVVGPKESRSRSMEDELMEVIISESIQGRQMLLPGPMLLDATMLPLIRAEDIKLEHLPRRCGQHHHLRMMFATDRAAAKLLMTQTRDASVAGPALRNAHHHIGRYLATEFLTELIGLEEFKTQHVQNKLTIGYRLLDEEKTLIVALMRGGEPMAFGVNEAFPLAHFLHAKEPTDIKVEHLRRLSTLVLVDSVVNSGKSVVEFVEHVRSVQRYLHIVVVAGVVQADSVDSDGVLVKTAATHGGLSLVALRTSTNRYTGTGTTDTGNRLFNTTYMR